jgi:hypothetical protein
VRLLERLFHHPSEVVHFRFAELFGGGQATDRVRNQQVPKVGPTLDVLGASTSAVSFLLLTCCMADEAYTTENWIVCYIPLATVIYVLTFLDRSGFTRLGRKTY